MLTPAERSQLIEKIRTFPGQLEALVSRLSIDQLTAFYPPEPWTIQQIVHHCADSHINSVIRLKLILTMDQPKLQGYDQDIWVTLPDVQLTPVQVSIDLLKALHTRWCAVLDNLEESQWSRAGIHSELGEITVTDLLRIYARHGEEHLEQIRRALGGK